MERLPSRRAETGWSLPPFRFLIRKSGFRHQHDMRKLILAALVEPDKEVVVRSFATEGGLAKIEAMLSKYYRLDAGSSSDYYSFQHVAVPFCYLLSNNDVRHTVRIQDLQSIYAKVLGKTTFFLRYSECVKQILQNNGDAADRNEWQQKDPNQYQPKTVFHVIIPFGKLCHAIMIILSDSRAESFWSNIVLDLREQTGEFIDATQDASHDARKALKELDELADIITTIASYGKPSLSHGSSLAASQGSEASTALINAFIEAGPGTLSKDGPRNDNDNVNFREIQPIPTESEVLCLRDPYLPYQGGPLPSASSGWIHGPVERHLDIQFRLLREDMIAPVRKSVQHFFLENTLSTLGTSSQFQFGTGRDSEGSCLIFRDVSVEEAGATVADGFVFRRRFSQPFKDNSASARKTAWTKGVGSRMLQPSSLVCLAFDVSDGSRITENCRAGESNPMVTEDTAAPSFANTSGAVMVFGIVTAQGRGELGTDREYCDTLHVHPVASKDNEELINRLWQRPRREENSALTNVMLQVRGHFIAGLGPVLRALQSIRFEDIRWMKRISADPRESAFENGRTNEGNLPQYLCPASQYDLSFLLRDSSRLSRRDFREINIADTEGLMRLLKNSKGDLILDETQIDAFVNGITQEIALIQGPPGCGKTFIGVQIIRALLRNSSGRRVENWEKKDNEYAASDEGSGERKPKLDPILCICYTNHALDQFLVNLIESGAVAQEEVVRIGSRSKAPELEDRSLQRVVRDTLSAAESWQARASKKARCTLQEEIQETSKRTRQKQSCNGDHFKEWVRRNDPVLYGLVSGFGGANESEDFDYADVEIVGDFFMATDSWVGEGKGVLGQEARRQRIQSAHDIFCQETRLELQKLYERHDAVFKKLQEDNNHGNLLVLRKARVIGCTSSGAAKHNGLLRCLGARVIICEEAAEVMEGHILASLSERTEHLILIGDHLQLRPKVSEYRLSREAGRHFDLDISLFERLVRDHVVPIVKLTTQRRMHPVISEIPRRTLYPTLLDSDVVEQYPQHPRGFLHPLFLCNAFPHRGLQKRNWLKYVTSKHV